MSIHHQHGAGEEEVDDELSGSENDSSFSEDIEALKQACLHTGTNLNEAEAAPTGSDSEDDFELFRSIRSRLALSEDVSQPLSMEARTLLPTSSHSDNDEDDFQTLSAIQRRFLSYSSNDTLENSTVDHMGKTEPVYTMTILPVKDATWDASCGNFQYCEKDGNMADLSSDNVEMQHVDLIQCDQSDAMELSTLANKSSRFPKSALLLIDAIKKNRFYQKFLRSKLTQIEVKIEENNKLKKRVKVLKDFQASCKKMISRALSKRKDPHIQFISARKSRTSQDLIINDKRVFADHGPPEISSVHNYRMALTRIPSALPRKNWSRKERKKLEKGIKQQLQERVLQVPVDLFTSDGSSGDGNNLDEIIASVKDLEITPEKIRGFLPKVNWDKLASMYVKGRSGAGCETRWLNNDDPLINHNQWTTEEDRKLLSIVKEKQISNWFDIALSLGSNRTPFQCLVRYQRSWNKCILKKKWTAEDDDQLRIAVELFGEHDWQSVASTLEGRTGTQCSNRWKKSLHPTRKRVGRWDPLESTRLKVAIMFFGPKNWIEIAKFVPGRNDVQCRERWRDCLDPNVNCGSWTENEDLILEAAVKEHGFCWSKIATCLPSRIDYQCRRRWGKLHPELKLLHQELKRKCEEILPSNFVDRASERPALWHGFDKLLMATSEPDNTDQPSKEKRKKRGRRLESEKETDLALCKHFSERGHNRYRKGAQAGSVEVPGMNNESEAVEANGHDDGGPNKQRNRCLENNNCTRPAQGVLVVKKRKRKLASGSKNCTKAEDVTIGKKRRKSPIGIGHTNCIDREQDVAIQTEERKRQSESNECVEAMQDNSSSHPLSTLCMTTKSNHEAEPSGGRHTTKKKKKRKVHSELGEEQTSCHSEKCGFPGVADGTKVMQNKGAKVDILNVGDAARKKSNARPGSKGKTTSNISTSLSPRCTSAGIENLSSNKNSENQCRTGRSNEPCGDSDGITLASFLHDKSKKSIPTVADADGDEMTLACFIRNTLKGRCLKRQMVMPGDTAV